MAEFVPNYNKFPVVHVKEKNVLCSRDWNNVCTVIKDRIQSIPSTKKIIALECYTEILDEEILTNLQSNLEGEFILTKNYMLSEGEISQMVYPDVTDDAVFGYMTRLQLKNFFDADKIENFRKELENKQGTIIVYGVGATLLAQQYDLLIYFDMTRWEGQLRQRRNEVSNLGVNNKKLKASLQYKQAYFVDWRVVDRHKRTLMNKWDFVVDTVKKDDPKIVEGKAFNEALKQTAHQPFRVVPFFDPGPWGGQSVKTFVTGNASLEQNIPNPFNQTTTINYTLPKTYSSAKIIITDKSGKALKEVNVFGSGKKSLKIDASTLASNAYNYSLYVDGRLIDTKQMILAK